MGLFKKVRRPRHPANAADGLFTEIQQHVLGVLFGNPKRRFTAEDIVHISEARLGPVHRELARLEKAHLVTVRRGDQHTHYQANVNAPAFEEVRALVVKTFDLADVLRAALAAEGAKIQAAFAYGAAVRGPDAPPGGIGVLVVSESLLHADLDAAMEDASKTIGRKINPTLLSPREFARRVREKHVTVMRPLGQPRIWLLGAQR
jgi:hypothetical protein